jgi:hypothetical protein
LQRKATAVFARDASLAPNYTLSPQGEYLVRLGSWPTFSAQVWSFQASKLLHTISLSPEAAQEIVGFIGPEQFIVHGQAADGKAAMEVLDAKTGQRARAIFAVHSGGAVGSLALSPDGRYLAATGKSKTGQTLELFLYDTKSGSKDRSVPLSKIDARLVGRASGLAFSSDGSRLAILFEQSNQGFLMCFSMPTATKLGEHLYPGRFGARVAGWPQGSPPLVWLARDTVWLLYGTLLYNAQSGDFFGDLDISDVVYQRVIDQDTAQLLCRGQGASTQLLQIKLDLSKFPEPRGDAGRSPSSRPR